MSAFSEKLRLLLKKIYHCHSAIVIRIQERTFKNGVKYIFRDNKSDKLLIVFSGIGGDYNYRRSLSDSTWNQLFIKDSWAYGLSYYLYEKGCNLPEILTSEVIEFFIDRGNYRSVNALGSSKGGSAAVYFGLKHCFNEIYAGACQYLVGNYIGIYHKKDGYYPKLMGDIPQENGIAILNEKYEKMVESRKKTTTIVHLIYSTDEHTYNDDIIPLIRKLDECQISHTDQIESFSDHSMIALSMKKLCKTHFR